MMPNEIFDRNEFPGLVMLATGIGLLFGVGDIVMHFISRENLASVGHIGHHDSLCHRATFEGRKKMERTLLIDN
ncbi:hypothetical protein K469DRAFT_374108 [Zopfia rhizophila CBS 207.26]|uniref:Uncharacterized protein n=1 Tax=Zopfia rhizophila CBS 207.26 TaxID=1314779 RepID=A0A6A6ELI3_9PEZI|nr:hypothetical protein K469DRAFT_374108 [Zopfia rhizophila CBS 207.26]